MTPTDFPPPQAADGIDPGRPGVTPTVREVGEALYGPGWEAAPLLAGLPADVPVPAGLKADVARRCADKGRRLLGLGAALSGRTPPAPWPPLALGRPPPPADLPGHAEGALASVLEILEATAATAVSGNRASRRRAASRRATSVPGR